MGFHKIGLQQSSISRWGFSHGSFPHPAIKGYPHDYGTPLYSWLVPFLKMVAMIPIDWNVYPGPRDFTYVPGHRLPGLVNVYITVEHHHFLNG